MWGFQMSADDKIRGVEREIIERILAMLQDKYPAFDGGTYYLAMKFGIENVIGFHNLRDMITHIKTAIVDVNTLREREDQLLLAEEHLRRALVEPYELAAAEMFKKASDLYREYLDLILIAKKEDINFIKGPSQEVIEQLLKREVPGLMAQGREKKAVNLWDTTWEDGVKAFELAAERSLYAYEHMQKDVEVLKTRNLYWKNRVYFIWGLTATALFGIAGIIITIMLAK